MQLPSSQGPTAGGSGASKGVPFINTALFLLIKPSLPTRSLIQQIFYTARNIPDTGPSGRNTTWIKKHGGTSLVVQWFRHHTSSARGVSLIPGTKIPYAMWHGKNKNQQNKTTKKHGNHPQGDPTPPTRLLYILFLTEFIKFSCNSSIWQMGKLRLEG